MRENPEEALQRSNRKFLERFERLEKRASGAGTALEDMQQEELDHLWEEIKKTGS